MNLGSFILRRLAWSVLVLVGLSVVIFVIARVIPGDPARIALGPTATQDQVVALRAEMGLDLPVPVQYARYMGNLVRGDLGRSLTTQRAVRADVADGFPATLELVISTLTLVVAVGVPMGVMAARRKDRWVDNVNRLVALLGVVTPSFLLAILLQLLAGYGLGLLPVAGRLTTGVRFTADLTGFMTIDTLLHGRADLFLDALHHLILPTIALSASVIGQVARITRSSMIDVGRQDYIEAARAFGIPERVSAFKYALKPSFIPTLTILGLEFAALIGNAFVVELVFGWGGLASYGVRTILNKDFNAVMGVVMVSGAMFVGVNLLIDLAVGYVDPRIRVRGARA